MSRKRETRREAKKELARQLGVAKEEVPDELREHQRVTSPELRAKLEVAHAKRGLLTKKRPLVAHVALYVVDAAGVRHARQARFSALVERTPVEIEMDDRSSHDVREPVRYARPGHFLALALALEGGDDAAHDTVAQHLGEPAALTLALDDKVVTLDDRALARLDAGRSVDVMHHGAALLPTEGVTYAAAALVSVAAAHRVRTQVRLPLHSRDARLEATLVLELRL